MGESYHKTERITHLILNEKEAQYLRGLLQNALIENEPEEDARMRGELFDLLTLPSQECPCEIPF